MSRALTLALFASQEVSYPVTTAVRDAHVSKRPSRVYSKAAVVHVRTIIGLLSTSFQRLLVMLRVPHHRH